MDRFIFLLCLLIPVAPASLRAQDPYLALNPVGQSGATSKSFSDTDSVLQPSFEVLDAGRPVEPQLVSRVASRAYRLIGGYEFDWLQPRFSENVSVVVTRPTGNQAYAFDHVFETSPRIWVAVENCRCNGVRASYWYFDTDAPTQVTFATAGESPLSVTMQGAGGNLSRTAFANLGDAMTSDHHLEMRTIDLEGTHRIRFSCTEAIASFGLRYAMTHQRAHAVATDGTGALTELVCQDLDFEGFGPTLGAEFTRQLFARGSLLCRLSCYASTRGSLLIGTQTQEIVLVTAGGATLAEDEHQQDDFMPIAELSGGLQLLAQPFGRGLWRIRTGYRAESWFGAGGPVDADSNLGLHGMLLSISAQW